MQAGIFQGHLIKSTGSGAKDKHVNSESEGRRQARRRIIRINIRIIIMINYTACQYILKGHINE